MKSKESCLVKAVMHAYTTHLLIIARNVNFNNILITPTISYWGGYDWQAHWVDPQLWLRIEFFKNIGDIFSVNVCRSAYYTDFLLSVTYGRMPALAFY